MEKTCLTCGEKLTGRADKKYCNDACKNEFHNQQNSQRSTVEKQQWSLARKNRGILSGILASGMAEIGVTDLERFGFNFEGLTGLKRQGKGIFLLYCFEFMLKLRGNACVIKKWIPGIDT
jgi:hypothetical protein